jgi:hypothetical protein
MQGPMNIKIAVCRVETQRRYRCREGSKIHVNVSKYRVTHNSLTQFIKSVHLDGRKERNDDI